MSKVEYQNLFWHLYKVILEMYQLHPSLNSAISKSIKDQISRIHRQCVGEL